MALVISSSSQSMAFHTGRQSRPITPPLQNRRSPRFNTNLRYSNWDAFETPDSIELLIGGTRYQMVELPDSMMSTTLWVGNLCEFVTDEMLSEIFQQASSLKFVPACVARKPNMESLKYGFVTFRSEEETEAAMNLFHGYEVNGKCLKVEAIKDHEKFGRIKVPEKIIDYAVGPVRRRRNGELNTMRRATVHVQSSNSANERGGRLSRSEREQRRLRMEKRKSRGRYKNQQRKNSRATRVVP